MMQNNMRTSTLSLKDKVMRTHNYQERSVPKFLKKVFHILEENKFDDLISWSNDGCALVLKKPTDFAEKVLPLYFKHNNFASFVRQLNMYNFKKRKNYHYDHVYGHEMFKKGRIDLLRNIRRKCGENPLLTSIPNTDSQIFCDERSTDVDVLVQENLQHKKVQKVLSSQLQFIESKVRDLKNEISTLHTQHKQQKVNEDFLKNVVKALSIFHGPESIQKAIEAATYEQSWSSDSENNGQECAYESSASITQYNSSNVQNTAYNQSYLPQAQKINKYQSKREVFDQFAKTPAPFNNQYVNEYDLQVENTPFPQNAEVQELFSSEDYDQAQEYEKSSSADTYMSWYLEFEKNHANSDAFLGTNNNCLPHSNLDVDVPFSSENQLSFHAGF